MKLGNVICLAILSLASAPRLSASFLEVRGEINTAFFNFADSGDISKTLDLLHTANFDLFDSVGFSSRLIAQGMGGIDAFAHENVLGATAVQAFTFVNDGSTMTRVRAEALSVIQFPVPTDFAGHPFVFVTMTGMLHGNVSVGSLEGPLSSGTLDMKFGGECKQTIGFGGSINAGQLGCSETVKVFPNSPPAVLSLDLVADSTFMATGSANDVITASANFRDTAYISSVQIFDENMVVLPGATLLTDAGTVFQAFVPPESSVPEPATWMQLTLAIFGGSAFRMMTALRRRRSPACQETSYSG